MIQKSLVLMKPDAVQRGVVGEVLERFERAGLKIVGAKLVKASRELAEQHYKKDESWHKKIGEITKQDCEKFGLDEKDIFGTSDVIEMGKIVNGWLYDLFEMGPVFAFVLEGPNAVEKIRNLVGSTYPNSAPAGTIRGDFGLDSPFTGLKRKRAVLNLIHASGAISEAEDEIKLWFKPEEILSYKRAIEDVYNY